MEKNSKFNYFACWHSFRRSLACGRIFFHEHVSLNLGENEVAATLWQHCGISRRWPLGSAAYSKPRGSCSSMALYQHQAWRRRASAQHWADTALLGLGLSWYPHSTWCQVNELWDAGLVSAFQFLCVISLLWMLLRWWFHLERSIWGIFVFGQVYITTCMVQRSPKLTAAHADTEQILAQVFIAS